MRKILSLVITLLLVCGLCAVPFAASAEDARAVMMFSANTVVVGNTVTVTPAFSASVPLGAVQATLTYDSALMEFVEGANANGGNGTVTLVAYGNGSAKNLSFPLTFKALAAGTCLFSVNAVELVAWDESSLGTPGAGARMTVNATATTTTTTATTTTTTTTTTTRPTTTTTRPSTTTTTGSGTTTTTTTATPTDPDDDTTLTIGGVTYHPATPEATDVPVGYTAETLPFGAVTLNAYVSENGAITLLYLATDTDPAAWFVTDTAADAVYPYYPLELGGVTYHFLAAEAPLGLTAVTLPVDGIAYPVFTFEQEARKDFFVFKAITDQGSVGFYCWDTIEDTVQRYVPLTAIPTAPTVTTTTTASATATTTTAADEPTSTTPLPILPWAVAGGLGILCVALGILAVVFYRRNLPPPTYYQARH